MTLGPSIAMLALLDRRPGRIGEMFVTFGRVPLFYYVVHLYLIHLSSRAFYMLLYREPFSSMREMLRVLTGQGQFPDWYGHGLGVVYLAWVLTIFTLYPVCRWYAGVKQRSHSPMMSYL